MDGMTGFNPEQVKKEIADFALEAGNACADVDEAYGTFFYEMKNYWASPKAVEFSETYMPRIKGLIDEMSDAIKRIVEGVVEAYNSVATANGTPTAIDVDTIIFDVYGYKDSFGTKDANGIFISGGLSADNNGLVGMNISAVRDIVIPEFTASINKEVNDLYEIPTSIAFYDEDGSQHQAYESNIRGFVEKFNELNESLFASMKEALETETNNVLLAKQQATDSFTSSAQ